MNKTEIIKQNFSRYAELYDTYSYVQSQAGLKLIKITGHGPFRKILDIGCGTGNYTRLLRNKFPSAVIRALDISDEMIKVAQRKLQNQRIDFIVADAEEVTLNEKFDLITSNACFQWFNHLHTTIANYKSLLKEDGIISFSIFGPRTFCELSECLKILYGKETLISSAAFIDKAKIYGILANYFDRIDIAHQLRTEVYTSLQQLLNMIKYTGARGTGIDGQRINKSQMIELEKIYKENFKTISATYQTFYCRATKRT